MLGPLGTFHEGVCRQTQHGVVYKVSFIDPRLNGLKPQILGLGFDFLGLENAGKDAPQFLTHLFSIQAAPKARRRLAIPEEHRLADKSIDSLLNLGPVQG